MNNIKVCKCDLYTTFRAFSMGSDYISACQEFMLKKINARIHGFSFETFIIRFHYSVKKITKTIKTLTLKH